MNILFKCDHSKFIGLGHLNRSQALAKVFKQNNHKCFFLGLKPGIIKKNIISKTDEKKDLDFTERFIKKKKINIVVKDIYSLSFKWEQKISNLAFLVVIGDYNNIKHYCNIYINYHYNLFKKNNYKNLKKKTCKKLIGPKYSIIKDLRFKKKINFKDKTISFYMGGADKNMFMLKLTNIFKKIDYKDFKKIFLLNSNHLKNKNLMKNLSRMKNVKVLKNKTQNFHQLINSSNLCISAAGQTMLEQLSLKKNCLIFPQNDFQKKIIKLLKKTNAVSLISSLKKINYQLINRLMLKKKLRTALFNKSGKYLIYRAIISQQKS